MFNTNKYYLLFVFTFSFFSLQGKFSINNVEISTTPETQNWMTCEDTNPLSYHLSLKSNENLEIETLTFHDSEYINKCYNNLINGETPLTPFSSGEFIQMQAGQKFSQNNRLLQAKGIFYQAKLVEIANSVFKTNSISLMGETVKLYNSYFEAFTLEIESNEFSSPLQLIRFVFDSNTKSPFLVDGEIDFNNNRIDLVVTGVKRIEMLFRPHAFR